jgi:HAD superfamily hydrolase (TIGR01509 family)
LIETAQIALVVFDCDGVLVDSERLTHEVLVSALAELGLEFDVDTAMARFMGNTLEGTIEIVEAELGRPLPSEFVSAWRARLYEEFRSRPVRAVPGVEAVLDALSVPACVVSNGPFAKMRTTLGVTGLLERFENGMFSPDLGLPGKPAPDLFLAAAAAFAVDPRHVLVIEDSPTGVRGARAAGMKVLGFAAAPHTDASALAAAGATLIHGMEELGALLAR